MAPGSPCEEVAQPGGLGVQPGAVEDVAVHHLDRRRLVRQDGRRGRQGVEQVGELDDEHGLRPRQLDQAQLRLDDDAERPLRADEQVGQVEAAGPARRPEGVEVVAAHAAEDLRDSGARSPRHAPRPAGGPRDSTPLPGPPGEHFASSSGSSSGPQLDDAAVGQHDLQLEHVIDRLAVDDRAGAGGVVGDHAADRGPVRRRDVGGELQAERLQLPVQVVEHAARLRRATQRSAALISRTRLRYLEQSRMTPGPDRTGPPATCRRRGPSAAPGTGAQAATVADDVGLASWAGRRRAARSDRRWRRWSTGPG